MFRVVRGALVFCSGHLLGAFLLFVFVIPQYGLLRRFLAARARLINIFRSVVEMGKSDLLKEFIYKGYDQFSGFILERYFRQWYSEKERVTEVSHWWDKNSDNEIDVIAVEKLDKRVTVGEVKRNKKKISMQTLEDKFANIRAHFRGYDIQFVSLSLSDM